MRVGEAIALKNDDIALEHNRIIIKKTKNQQQRMIPVHPSMHQVMCQYKNARNTGIRKRTIVGKRLRFKSLAQKSR